MTDLNGGLSARIDRWASECLMRSPTGEATATAVYESFHTYCESKNWATPTMPMFSMALGDKGYRKEVRIGPGSRVWYLGITIIK